MEDTPQLHGVVEKYEFYFLGLTFTLLGLAVQTFKPTTVLSADVVEIGGWLCLLVSGLLGMSKIEWIPVILHVKNRQSYLEEAQGGLQKAESFNLSVRDSQSGQFVNVAEVSAVAAKSLAEVATQGSRLERWYEIKYRWQKACFLIGLVALVLARAQGVILRLVERIA